MRRHVTIATDRFLPHDATPIATLQRRQDQAKVCNLCGTHDECRDYNLFIGDRPHAEGIVTANDQPRNRLLCGAAHHCTTRTKRACRLSKHTCKHHTKAEDVPQALVQPIQGSSAVPNA